MNTPQATTASLFTEAYFVFLNMQASMVAQNMSIHDRISSAGCTAICQDESCAPAYDDGSAQYAPLIRNPADPSGWSRNPDVLSGFLSFHASTLISGGGAPYIQEYEGETIRLAEFPLLPSRFSCVFAFKSIDDCERAHVRFGWPRERVRSSKLAVWPRTRIARLSMDIVSILISTTDGVGGEERKALWRLYWNGASIRDIPSPALRQHEYVQRSLLEGDIWEQLVEGQLVVDRDSRF